MICKHNRIHKFIKKNMEDRVLGYIYCCIDCKELWEFYGLDVDEDLEKNVIVVLDMALSDNHYECSDIVNAVVRDEADITRRKLDGELPRTDDEMVKEKLKIVESIIKGNGILKPFCK